MNWLESVQVFVRVAELGSFTRTADSMDLPKASVSNAVQSLESQLGTRLLHRTTRKVQLTQDGRAFYERSKDLLADVDDVQSMFQQDQQALRGRLRVDMPSGIARDHVIPQLTKFLSHHPRLEIELGSTDRKVDLIREGYDCVLRIGTLEDDSLVARPLGRFPLINVASPAYLEAYGTPRTPEDLARHRLVHYVVNFGSKPYGFEYFDGTAYRIMTMKGVVTVNSAEAYQASCIAGLGIIQVPAIGMRRFIDDGTLVEILPEYRAEPMPVTLVYAHRRNLSRRVQVFMSWIAELLAPHLEKG